MMYFNFASKFNCYFYCYWNIIFMY